MYLMIRVKPLVLDHYFHSTSYLVMLSNMYFVRLRLKEFNLGVLQLSTRVSGLK